MKRSRVGPGMRETSSGVLLRAVAMAGRGRKPQRARKRVSAIVISGLWFGSVKKGYGCNI